MRRYQSCYRVGSGGRSPSQTKRSPHAEHRRDAAPELLRAQPVRYPPFETKEQLSSSGYNSSMQETVPSPRERSNRITRPWEIMRDMDSGIHAAFMRTFPRFLPIFDKVLEWVFNFVTHPAFAIIAALLLVPLVATNVINVVVAVPIGAAWLVALLWSRELNQYGPLQSDLELCS